MLWSTLAQDIASRHKNVTLLFSYSPSRWENTILLGLLFGQQKTYLNIFHKLTGRGGISSAIKLVISCNSCGFLCANSIISEIPVLLALDVFRVEVLALASLIPLALRLKNNILFVISFAIWRVFSSASF